MERIRTTIFKHLNSKHNTMNKSYETICDDNGIELIVGYEWEQSPSQIEEGHGLHEVGLTIATFLKSVEIVIAGRGIELLPMLKESQKNEIYSKLQYDL